MAMVVSCPDDLVTATHPVRMVMAVVDKRQQVEQRTGGKSESGHRLSGRTLVPYSLFPALSPAMQPLLVAADADGRREQLAQLRRRQQLFARAVAYDAARAHEDDALNLG